MRNRDQLRFLLLEARLDPEMREHERSCLVRAGSLRPEQFTIHNVLEEAPSERLLDGYDAVLIGGTGDYSVSSHRGEWFQPLVDFTNLLLDRNVPSLGLCYGFHLMAAAVGGRVERRPEEGETGTHLVELTPEGQRDVLFEAIPSSFEAQQGHHDVVMEVPGPYVRLAGSQKCLWQALRHPDKPFYGLQFHPELSREDFMLRMRKYRHVYASTPGLYEQIDASVKETRVQAVIHNFVERVVLATSPAGA
ncbi:MAG: type 1 glutamine amidotransferase [Candidatus Eremiobacterota bacterium]